MESETKHMALLSAIEMDQFDMAREILVHDVLSRYIRPVGTLQVTALQMAAWKGRIDLMDQLYQKGANVNFADRIGRCALYYAAYCGHVEVTEWLLQREAYVDSKVSINSCTKDFHNTSKSCCVGTNLPLPVCWGRTPLHEAVKNNHAEVVRLLVKADANVNAKDERNITPLLLAGSQVNSDDYQEMNKFVEIIKILISAKALPNVIHPDTGTTALHHAAMLGSAEATNILLENDAWPMFKCKSSGSTPLHIAASTGSADTLDVLLKKIPLHRIDTRDQIARTALHRASYQGHRDCARILIKRGGNLAATTQTGVTVADAIFAYIPRPLAFLTDILDSCVRTTNNNSPLEKYDTINIDFSILAPKYQMQMGVVMAIIVATGCNIAQLTILHHPVLETYLKLKWMRLRIYFFLLMLLHILFIISLSSYSMMLVQEEDEHMLYRRILTICSCLLLLHYVIQVLLEPRLYLRQYETWISLICATLSLIMSLADKCEKNVISAEDKDKKEKEFQQCAPWLLHCMSITILLGWMQIMLLIGRFPMWGYYALMFSIVLKNMLKVLLAFAYLIIGFALSFVVLFHGKDEFHNAWRAVMRTVIMMLGEYEYTDMFKGKYLPTTTRIIFFVFTILAIVLINLMTGLAVNDIQALEKEGHIRRLLKQAEFVSHLERVTSHRIFRSNWLRPGLKIHSSRDIPTKITLSYRENYSRHVNHINAARNVPSELKEALFLLATKTAFNEKLAREKNAENTDAKMNCLLSNLEKSLQKWRARCQPRVFVCRRLSKRRKLKKSLRR